jgi:hypothetical protein
LEEAIEVPPVTPPPLKIVEVELASGQIGDNGILPLRQLHGQAGDFAAEKPGCTLHRLGEPQPLAGGPDGGYVTNFGPNGNNVRQGKSPSMGRSGK